MQREGRGGGPVEGFDDSFVGLGGLEGGGVALEGVHGTTLDVQLRSVEVQATSVVGEIRCGVVGVV